MTYRFIAVHLKVAMSKTLVGENWTFVGCEMLVPGAGLDGSKQPCPGRHLGGPWAHGASQDTEGGNRASWPLERCRGHAGGLKRWTGTSARR